MTHLGVSSGHEQTVRPGAAVEIGRKGKPVALQVVATRVKAAGEGRGRG